MIFIIKGIFIIHNDKDSTDIQVDIVGPESTPFENGLFRCKLIITNDFPQIPPKGIFLTKIFHPNVSTNGEICVNTLKKDWSPQSWSLANIFSVYKIPNNKLFLIQVIRCLLIIPFPESALNEEAGKLFMEDYNQYFSHAKMITELHAPKHYCKQTEDKKLNTKSQYEQAKYFQYNQNHSQNLSSLKNSNLYETNNAIKFLHAKYSISSGEKEILLNQQPHYQKQSLKENNDSNNTPTSMHQNNIQGISLLEDNVQIQKQLFVGKQLISNLGDEVLSTIKNVNFINQFSQINDILKINDNNIQKIANKQSNQNSIQYQLTSKPQPQKSPSKMKWLKRI